MKNRSSRHKVLKYRSELEPHPGVGKIQTGPEPDTLYHSFSPFIFVENSPLSGYFIFSLCPHALTSCYLPVESSVILSVLFLFRGCYRLFKRQIHSFAVFPYYFPRCAGYRAVWGHVMHDDHGFSADLDIIADVKSSHPVIKWFCGRTQSASKGR